jgi:heme-degrading monooxygenase HmoA
MRSVLKGPSDVGTSHTACPLSPFTTKEKDMYARCVSVKLTPKGKAEFTTKLEAEIIPLLRKQKGFQDELTLISPGRNEALAVSLWDNKDSAETYHRGAFVEVTKILSKLVEGTPQVETYDVANSTVHKIAAALKAA